MMKEDQATIKFAADVVSKEDDCKLCKNCNCKNYLKVKTEDEVNINADTEKDLRTSN